MCAWRSAIFGTRPPFKRVPVKIPLKGAPIADIRRLPRALPSSSV